MASKEEFKGMREEATGLASALSDIKGQLKEIGKSSGDVSSLFALAVKDTNSLVASTNKLRGITTEDLKDKKKARDFAKEAAKTRANMARNEATIATLTKRRLSAQKQGNDALVKSIDKGIEKLQDSQFYSGEILNNYEGLVRKNNELNSNTAWIDGLGDLLNQIPILGPLISGPFKKMSQSIRNSIIDEEGFFETATKGLASLSSVFTTLFVASLVKASSESVEIQRNLQMSAKEAQSLRHEFDEIALSSGNALHNQANLLEAQIALNKELGVTRGTTKDQLLNQTLLTKRLGVSAESSAEIAKYQTFTGKSAKQTNLEIANATANLQKETGIAFKLSDIFEEVAKTNMGLKATYGFNNELLAEQVVLTKKIGINMAQAEQIARGTLDFEQSIQNELEAELLTGKNLNLEQARYLALQGKSSEAAAEILNQVGSAAQFTNMNVIAQESLAKAVGLTRDELIGSVHEREVLEKLGKQSIAQAIEEGKTREEIIAAGGKELLQAYERESVTEKFEGIVIKIQRRLTELAEGPLGNIAEKFANILDNAAVLGSIITGTIAVGLASMAASLVNSLKTLKIITAFEKIRIGLSTAYQVVEEAILKKKVGQAIMSAITSKATIPVVGVALGLAAAAAIGAMAQKYFMDDGLIGPGGNPVLLGEEGSIQLNKKDSMVVGTDLFGDKSTPPSTLPLQENQEQIQEIKKQLKGVKRTNELLSQLVSNTKKLNNLESVSFYEVQ
tara:strand:+ start:1055 stop:3259 length:2205 start_codon:yes stop_codon:yes gene_type:complete